MKKTAKRKLLLDRQTVHVLKPSTLQHVHGAGDDPSPWSLASAMVCTDACSSQKCVDKVKTFFGVCTVGCSVA